MVKILRPSQLMAEDLLGPGTEEGAGAPSAPEEAGGDGVAVKDKENRSPGRTRKRMDPGQHSEYKNIGRIPLSGSGSTG